MVFTITGSFILKKCIYTSVLPACMYVYHVHAEPVEAGRGVDPLEMDLQMLSGVILMLGTESGSFARHALDG